MCEINPRARSEATRCGFVVPRSAQFPLLLCVLCLGWAAALLPTWALGKKSMMPRVPNLYSEVLFT